MEPDVFLHSMNSDRVISFLRCAVKDVTKKLNRMRLSDIKLKIFGHRLDDWNNGFEIKPRILPAIRNNNSKNGRLDSKYMKGVMSDGLASSPVAPVNLQSIPSDLLDSGAVIYPGCLDTCGHPVIIFNGQHGIWMKDVVWSMTQLFLYFYNITRESHKCVGLTLLVNARNVSSESCGKILKTIHSIQAIDSGILHSAHFIVDEAGRDLLLRSEEFSVEVDRKIIMVENKQELDCLFDGSNLPKEIGGLTDFDHKTWLHFRQKLDAFTSDCTCAASRLLRAADEICDNDQIPASVRETEMLIEQHRQIVGKTFEDPVFVKLSKNGNDVLADLLTAGQQFDRANKCQESTMCAQDLFQEVQLASTQLESLAEERLEKLENCLLLRRFENRASYVLNAMSSKGEEVLDKHKTVKNNLKAIGSQQDDFEESCRGITKLFEKCRDVIEEGNLLTQQLGICDEATGIKDICRQLKSRLSSIGAQLGKVKKTIASTHTCYKMLEKFCESAISTKKFISDLKLEDGMHLQQLRALLSVLDAYLSSRSSPVSSNEESMVVDLLHTLDDNALKEKWKEAVEEYRKTDVQLDERRSLIESAIDDLKPRDLDKLISPGCGDVIGVTPIDFRTNVGYRDLVQSQECLVDDVFVSRNSSNPIKDASDDSGVLCATFEGQLSSVDDSLDTSIPADILKGVDDMVDSSCQPLMTSPKNPSKSVLDLDVLVPCSTGDADPTGELDSVIPPQASQFIPETSSKFSPSASWTSLNLFDCQSHAVTLPFHSASPKRIAKFSRNASVLEYMLKKPVFSTSDVAEPASPPWNFSGSESFGPAEGSMDSLQDSRESLNYSGDSLGAKRDATSSPNATFQSSFDSPNAENSTSKNKKWKMFRKTVSMILDGEVNFRGLQFRNRHCRSVDVNNSSETKKNCDKSPAILLSVNQTNPESWKCKYGWAQMPTSLPTVNSTRLVAQPMFRSMTDLRLAEDEEHRKRVLSLVMQEIVSTETDYINSLSYVIRNYIPELLRGDVAQSLRGKKHVIFGNIEKIHEFHSQSFLKNIQQCLNFPFRLGSVFLQHEEEFYLYALYNKNKPKSDALMEESGSSYFREKQMDLKDHLNLSSYLLKPIQRLAQYALFLRQIAKECPETHPDFSELMAALELVRFQLRHGNDLLAMDSLRGCDVNLQEQGMLLRQEEFFIFHGWKKCFRRVFLFEELLVFSKPSGPDTCIYKNSIKTSELGLTETVGNNHCRFEIWFRKRVPASSFILQATSVETKLLWVQDISRLLWKQTFRNRDRFVAEMASMGLGNQPSLDLKQNDNNITERSINVIAFRPKNLNDKSVKRRPHSLISVGSCSSTNSSFTSGYGSSLSSAFGTASALGITQEYPRDTNFIKNSNSCIALGSRLAPVAELSITPTSNGSAAQIEVGPSGVVELPSSKNADKSEASEVNSEEKRPNLSLDSS